MAIATAPTATPEAAPGSAEATNGTTNGSSNGTPNGTSSATSAAQTARSRQALANDLSSTSIDLLGWQRHAACRGLAAAIFYPSDEDEDTPDGVDPAFEAKAVCAECGVAGQCLEYAIAVREKDGVWGGQTAAERVRIIRRRRRAAARAKAAQPVAASA